jgi:hypothetical protein
MRLLPIADGFGDADTDAFDSLVDSTIMSGAEYVR